MDTWTALMLSRQRACDLQREFARHRLAKHAVSTARQTEDSGRTGGFTNLLLDSRRLSSQRREAS